jgi:uncharacterized iron-regulated protein
MRNAMREQMRPPKGLAGLSAKLRPLIGGLALAFTGCASNPAPAQAPPAVAAVVQSRIHYVDPSTGSDLSPAEVQRRLAGSDYVLLGELHDNPYHHQVQAELLRAVQKPGKTAVFFEMLEPVQEAPAQAYLKQGGAAPGFGIAVHWEPGWPVFSEYQPIFDVMIQSRMSVYSANLAKADMKAIAMGARDVVLPPMLPDQEAALAIEIEEGHCGMLPKQHLAPMANAQRARDLAMAEAMVKVEGLHVLIAGRGHTRKDRGVAFVLRAMGKSKVVSIGLFEESAELSAPALAAQYDIIGITPAPHAARPDPCEAFRKQHGSRE